MSLLSSALPLKNSLIYKTVLKKRGGQFKKGRPTLKLSWIIFYVAQGVTFTTTLSLNMGLS